MLKSTNETTLTVWQKKTEQAAGSLNLRQLYDTNMELAGQNGKPESPVNDKEGRSIKETEQQLNKWAEHIEEPLKRPAPLDHQDIQPAGVDLPIKCDKPTKEEIRRAIQQLKNTETAGTDDTTAEALNT